MSSPESLLRETIAALSVLDAERLESTCAQAERMAEAKQAAPAGSTRALQHTLAQLLASTDANLRLLRELQRRGPGTGENDGPGGMRWVR